MSNYVIAVYLSSDPGTYMVRIRFAFQKPGVTTSNSSASCTLSSEKNSNDYNSSSRFSRGKQLERFSMKVHALRHVMFIVVSWKCRGRSPSGLSQGQSKPHYNSDLGPHHAGAIHHRGTPNPWRNLGTPGVCCGPAGR
jgi:hypothetical protein